MTYYAKLCPRARAYVRTVKVFFFNFKVSLPDFDGPGGQSIKPYLRERGN